MQIVEHAHVIDDHAAGFARRVAVGARDSLHQRVVLHRLVEIDSADTGHVKASDPHRADEDEPQRVVLVLELLLQVFLLHPLAVREDIETLFLEVVDLALTLADNHSHIQFA
ncbi:hypothetical protein D9M68_711340 [compost metagenome]